jgi:hypothetical protein
MERIIAPSIRNYIYSDLNDRCVGVSDFFVSSISIGSMEDSSLFMQWALSTLLHEHGHPPPPASGDAGVLHHFSSSLLPELGYSPSLMSSMVPEEPPAREGHRATGRCSSGDTDSGSASVTALERDGRSPSQISAMYAAPRSSSGGATQPVSWNFSAASARPSRRESMRNSVTTDHDGGVPLMVQESPRPTRRTSERSAGSPSSAPCVQHHILAERKRREKINQRFIELSTVIPGLKKVSNNFSCTSTAISDADFTMIQLLTSYFCVPIRWTRQRSCPTRPGTSRTSKKSSRHTKTAAATATTRTSSP